MRECSLRETEPPPPCPYPRHWTDGTTDVFTPRFSGTRAPGVPTSRVIRAAPSPRGGSCLRKEQAECQRASAVICSRIAHAAGPPAPAVWQSVSAILLPLRASAWRHPVALQHAVEGAAVDAEHLSRPAHVAPALLEDAPHEVIDEQRNVLARRARRRELERHRRRAIVEVLAEAPLLAASRQLAVGRRDDAHVDGPPHRAAHRPYLVLLEDAQELRLERG